MRKARFTEEQIIGILREHDAGAKAEDLCRRHGISGTTFYKWKAKFGGMEASDAKRLRALEDENRRLKRLTRCQMHGWGKRVGWSARHDFGDKTFLGRIIKGRGFAEVEEALDILGRHPATARHTAQQIAVYFVGDNPPAGLVDRMTQTFMGTDGNIASVLDTLFHAPEFATSLGTRFKDPVRYVFSAVRLAYDTKVVINTAPIQNWLNRLGEGLYNHQTPDGYAMTSAAWNGSGQMITRFEIARQIGSDSARLFQPTGPDAAELPAFPLLQNDLYFSDLRYRLDASTRAALDKAISPQDWNTLFLSSPEFMH